MRKAEIIVNRYNYYDIFRGIICYELFPQIVLRNEVNKPKSKIFASYLLVRNSI